MFWFLLLHQITQELSGEKTLKDFEELTQFKLNINQTNDVHTTSILNNNLTDLKVS